MCKEMEVQMTFRNFKGKSQNFMEKLTVVKLRAAVVTVFDCPSEGLNHLFVHVILRSSEVALCACVHVVFWLIWSYLNLQQQTQACFPPV